jgi:hypothetical protein
LEWVSLLRNLIAYVEIFYNKKKSEIQNTSGPKHSEKGYLTCKEFLSLLQKKKTSIIQGS